MTDEEVDDVLKGPPALLEVPWTDDKRTTTLVQHWLLGFFDAYNVMLNAFAPDGTIRYHIEHDPESVTAWLIWRGKGVAGEAQFTKQIPLELLWTTQEFEPQKVLSDLFAKLTAKVLEHELEARAEYFESVARRCRALQEAGA